MRHVLLQGVEVPDVLNASEEAVNQAKLEQEKAQQAAARRAAAIGSNRPKTLAHQRLQVSEGSALDFPTGQCGVFVIVKAEREEGARESKERHREEQTERQGGRMAGRERHRGSEKAQEREAVRLFRNASQHMTNSALGHGWCFHADNAICGAVCSILLLWRHTAPHLLAGLRHLLCCALLLCCCAVLCCSRASSCLATAAFAARLW